MDSAIAALQSALSEMLKTGGQLPFYASVVGRNGAFAVITYRAAGAGLAAEVQYQREAETEAGFGLPINVKRRRTPAAAVLPMISAKSWSRR
jgi:hypothetical protein